MNDGLVEFHKVLLYAHDALNVYPIDQRAENGATDAKIQ